MRPRKLVNVQPPLPGFSVIPFSGKPFVKSRQTLSDEEHNPGRVHFDIGIHSKREYERPNQFRTERDIGDGTWLYLND